MSITPLDAARQQTGTRQPLVTRITIPNEVRREVESIQAIRLDAIQKTLETKSDNRFIRREQISTGRETLQLWVIPGKHLVVSRDNVFQALQPGSLSDNELELAHKALTRIR